MSMKTYEEQLRRLELYQELAISEKQFDEGKYKEAKTAKLSSRGLIIEDEDYARRIQKLDITKCDNMFARSFASYRLKMHLTVEAIEEKPLIFLHSKRAIT